MRGEEEAKGMIVAVASGKGGTGKTTIAVNLAVMLSAEGEDVTYADCDVEAPNGHIFLKPRLAEKIPIFLTAPHVDPDKCTGCGRCGEICRFSAIVCIKKKVLTFLELCHACGGCARVCPEGAIVEEPRQIGIVEMGELGGLGFVHGKLNIGEPLAPKIIEEVKKRIGGSWAILDAPPGAACPVIETIKGADHVLLVSEPTPFGLSDLEIAYEVTRKLGIACSLVINRADVGDDRLKRFAESRGVPVVLEIPDDRRIAECYSRGEMVVDALPEYRGRFVAMFERIAGAQACPKR